MRMARRFLEEITNSGCIFEICKFCKTAENMLDFYIMSKFGEMFGSGFEGMVVIVSYDSGFQVALD